MKHTVGLIGRSNRWGIPNCWTTCKHNQTIKHVPQTVQNCFLLSIISLSTFFSLMKQHIKV